MAQQIINVGASANDGTGDTLRLSQQKTNDNTTELYNSKLESIVEGSNITIDDTDPLNPIISASGGGGVATLGLIKIVDKAGDFFTNLATASAYIRTFTSATITNESFSNGTFWFTVPNGSSFADANSFLAGISSLAHIEDPLGLINAFADYAFETNDGNSILSDCDFGVSAFQDSKGDNVLLGQCIFLADAFQNSYGNNTLEISLYEDNAFYAARGINKFKKQIILVSTSHYFALQSTGRFEIYGDIGTTEASNYANFFSLSTAVIWALKAKETSNAGGIEGDLLTAQTNGAKLFFGYATAGGGSGDMTKAVYDTDDDGVVDSAKKEIVNFINKSGATITKGTIVYIKSSSSSATYPEVLKANATTEATSSKTIGAVFEDVLNDGIGYIVTSGEVRNLDTSAYVIGDKLWLSTTDGLVTTTVPTQPNHAVFIGTVTRAQSVNGRVLYAIQNGYEIEELHNVSNVSYNPAIDTDSLLIKDVTNSLWKRFTIANLKALISGEVSTKQTWLVKNSVPTSAHTGTTALTQIGDSILIPANTFSANDAMVLDVLAVSKTGTAGTLVWRLSHNTSDTLVGSTIIASANLLATQISGNMQRIFEINGGLLKCRLGGTNTGFTDKQASTVAGLSISFDPTIDNYFFRVVTLSNAGDSVVSTQILILR